MSQASYCDDTAHRADGAWAAHVTGALRLPWTTLSPCGLIVTRGGVAVDVRQNIPRFFVDVTADIACLRELKYMAVSSARASTA